MELNGKDHEQLLAPFVSMSLSEVKKMRCCDKFLQIIKTLWILIGLVLSYVPVLNLVAAVCDQIVEILTCLFRICPPRRQILVEAKDANGCITPFIITDRRSCCARTFGCGVGEKMVLALLSDEKSALLTTREQSCCFCCCKKYHLVDASEPRKVYATYKYRLCSCNCCKIVTTITSSGTNYGFVQPCCKPCRTRRNRIKPGKKLKEGQLAVKKNTFSCKDFCFSTIEIGMGDIIEAVDLGGLGAATASAIELSVGVSAKATEDAVDIAVTAKDIVVELKDCRKQLKEKGFKKLGFTWSIWDVDFPAECPGPQKLATLLFLIGVYCKVFEV